MDFRFSRHILKLWFESEPDFEKAVPILIYSNSVAKPLINHIGISLAISMMATNTINKCEIANLLKSKCMEIQLQEEVGQGNSHVSEFICVLVTRLTGDSEEIVLFFAQDTNWEGKIIWSLKILFLQKIPASWETYLGVGHEERVAFPLEWGGGCGKDDLDRAPTSQRCTLVTGGPADSFDLWEAVFPATRTQAMDILHHKCLKH